MRNRKGFIVAMVCVMFMGLTACGGEKDDSADKFNQVGAVFVTAENTGQSDSNTQEKSKMEIEEENEREVQEQSKIDIQKTGELLYDEQQEAQKQNETEVQQAQSEVQQPIQSHGGEDEEELEEKLAVYRQAREEAKPKELGGGVTMGGSVDPDKYGILFDSSIMSSFDIREMMEAIDTANGYVENTLGISVETRYITYMCVDPRIWAIYSAKDKGVADGYESENIYLREYYDNGTWQYLILVREGKGSAWEVIHHGSSFMEEE